MLTQNPVAKVLTCLPPEASTDEHGASWCPAASATLRPTAIQAAAQCASRGNVAGQPSAAKPHQRHWFPECHLPLLPVDPSAIDRQGISQLHAQVDLAKMDFHTVQEVSYD
jgi:hypothetical protein